MMCDSAGGWGWGVGGTGSGDVARMDCLHFRSRTSSSKDVVRANALAREGLSARSTTVSGSSSKPDEQWSCTSSSESPESEANLRGGRERGKKFAKVEPFKNPGLNPDFKVNYRAFLSKVFEKVVSRQFVTFSSLANLFPANRSTEPVLTKVRNDLLLAADSISAVLLDLSAAFDTAVSQASKTCMTSEAECSCG